MSKVEAAIQNLHYDVRTALDPVCDVEHAKEVIFKYQSKIEKLNESPAEFFQSHWGLCAQVDDALEEIYPDNFS